MLSANLLAIIRRRSQTERSARALCQWRKVVESGRRVSDILLYSDMSYEGMNNHCRANVSTIGKVVS